MMPVRIHPHAWERMGERGATEDEVRATVESGERVPAQHGRVGFRRNFVFDNLWRSRYCRSKQLEVYAVEETGNWLVITVITRYF